jgi:hypothetical protein
VTVLKQQREAIEGAIRERRFFMALMLIQHTALDLRGDHHHRVGLVVAVQNCWDARGTSVDAAKIAREIAATKTGAIAELWELFAQVAEMPAEGG